MLLFYRFSEGELPQQTAGSIVSDDGADWFASYLTNPAFERQRAFVKPLDVDVQDLPLHAILIVDEADGPSLPFIRSLLQLPAAGLLEIFEWTAETDQLVPFIPPPPTPAVLAESPTKLLAFPARARIQSGGNFFYAKVGETLALRFLLAGYDLAPQDLTMATSIALTVQSVLDGTLPFDHVACTFTPDASGIVAYESGAPIVIPPGRYRIDVTVTFSDASVKIFPDAGVTYLITAPAL